MLLTNCDNVHLTKDKLEEIIEETELMLGDFSNALIQLNNNLRSYFKDRVYTVNHPSTGQEIEVLLLNDFVEVLSKLSNKRLTLD